MTNRTAAELQAKLAARFPGVPALMREGDPAPYLHLYHAPSSICAQKVRATFAATKQPYISHTLNLMAGDSYDAVYVRVRAEGCNNSGLKLVQDHTGGTSVATSGCDPCVVPT